MPTTARIVADSISESGIRLVTMVLEYPRIIHSEFMTHRMFSRNASSSRAIPVEVQMKRIVDEPFFPSYWGANKRGMQAEKELTEDESKAANFLWEKCLNAVVFFVQFLVRLGVHKQLANRLLEPFSHIQVVVTATEWDNFFLQRLDKNAQPEIQELARVMKEAMDNSIPQILTAGEWHLPFISDEDIEWLEEQTPKYIYADLIKISVARCARVSYGLNERGWGDIEKDFALYNMLLTNNHWSPFEHQATPMNYTNGNEFAIAVLKEFGFPGGEDVEWEKGTTHMDRSNKFWSGNFKHFTQNRQLIQQSI